MSMWWFVSLLCVFQVTTGAEDIYLVQTANDWSVAAAQSAGGESVIVP